MKKKKNEKKAEFSRISFPQIDSHLKRLDEDLTHFAEDLKQGTLVGVNLCSSFDKMCCNYEEIIDHSSIKP